MNPKSLHLIGPMASRGDSSPTEPVGVAVATAPGRSVTVADLNVDDMEEILTDVERCDRRWLALAISLVLTGAVGVAAWFIPPPLKWFSYVLFLPAVCAPLAGRILSRRDGFRVAGELHGLSNAAVRELRVLCQEAANSRGLRWHRRIAPRQLAEAVASKLNSAR